MKILYISKNTRNQQFPWLIDYQDDSLLVGLKELYGDDVVDCNRRHNLYWDYSDEDVASEYGKGFTFTRVLNEDKTDRDDIVKKIKNKYFDLVIYGNVWRCLDHHELVKDNYDLHQIIYVDGEDNPEFHNVIKDKGLYAKRELQLENVKSQQEHMWKVFPCQFAFPTSKVNFGDKKEKKLAHSDPRLQTSYKFSKEVDYYQDYQFSKYGFTIKKAGWDCMRHYEIMANGCVPVFPELYNCPRYTMHRFPKSLLIKVQYFYETDFKWLEKNYDELRNDLIEHFKNFNTTEASAKYFLKDISLFKKFVTSNNNKM